MACILILYIEGQGRIERERRALIQGDTVVFGTGCGAFPDLVRGTGSSKQSHFSGFFCMGQNQRIMSRIG